MRLSFSCLLALLAFGLACSVLAQTTSTPRVPQPNPDATAALDRCLKKVGELPSYGLNFRQLAATPGLPTTNEGRLVFTPQRRIRYQLDSKHADTQARLTIICDGKTLWHLVDAGPTKEYTTYRLDDLEEELKRLATGQSDLDLSKVEELRKQLDLEHGFRGILPVLEDLKAKLTFTGIEPGTLMPDGGPPRPVVILDGEWNKEVRALIVPPKADPQKGPDGKENPSAAPPVDPMVAFDKRQNQPYVPRRAKLFIDKESSLPMRLEWWGPKKPGGPDELLSQFDWIWHPPMPAEQLATQFALTPEESKLSIKSLSSKEWLRYRVESMVRQQQREKEMLRGRGLDVAPVKP